MSQQPPARFVLDTNVFIGAHNDYYAPAFCPAFWDCLLHYFRAGRVVSIDNVKSEITKPNDLVQWAQNAPSGLFASTGDQQVVTAYSSIINWVQNNPQFTPAAKSKFAAIADGWLIAYGQANSAIVVTQEKFDAKAKTRVLIPNICRQFNVPYLNTFDMLSQLGVRFDLASTP